MSDVHGYPGWWGDVWVSTSGDAGPPAPGTQTQVVAHGYLPYKLRYEFECVAADTPHRIDSVLHGDFEGSASLTFEEVDGGTSVVLDFRPRVNKAGVRQLTPLLRPLFRSNHRWAMRRGQQRVVERLRA
jgi:Polyketide cyclase / dehydrase and lipid transport